MAIISTRPAETSRLAWASAQARAVWAPRFTAIQTAWREVEVDSVAAGVRSAALLFGRGGFRPQLFEGQVAPNRYVIARSMGTIEALQKAYAAGDDETVGSLLGYPECCRTFFHDVWNVQGKMDTTLSMGGHGTLQGPDGANILHRWAGVRLVPHLPCRWDCDDTCKLAERLSYLWTPGELAWVRSVLSWATRYSSLHGMAVITTPVYKVVASTDYEPKERRLDRSGMVPIEAPKGLVFPFTQPKVIQIQGLRRAVEAVNDRVWTDNGFSSDAAMNEAHDMVLAALSERPRLTVIDLGCGNGRLLEKVLERRLAQVVCGVEADAFRAQSAQVDIVVRRIEEYVQTAAAPYDVALISLRRLEEMERSGYASAFWSWRLRFIGQLLVYSYDTPQFARWSMVK